MILIFILAAGTYFLLNSGIFGMFSQSNTTASEDNSSQIKTSSLKDAVEKALIGTKGTYGITIKNLKTGESYYANEHKSFKAGSLYKLWIMVVVFNKIQDGSITEDQVLSQSVSILNNKFSIDPSLAELKKGRVTLSVNDALQQMITISHNYAALLLVEKIKLSTVAAYLEENGFYDSKVGTDGAEPVTNPFDMALFFEKLYQGELANQEKTGKMLDLLLKQQNKNKLPKYLPSDVTVAHKTGELGWFSHDAGIVYSPKGDYIIVVLSESESPAGAEDRIAELSKAVYEYF